MVDMNRNLSIRIKAAFLLVVFALNTLVGFACAMGVNMGFNTSHHHDEDAMEMHVHPDGKIHHHHHAANKHHTDKTESSKKDDCCNDTVIKFQDFDKTLNHQVIIFNNTPPIIMGSLPTITIAQVFQASPIKYIVRNFHPPPLDIRIQIQSFLI